MAPTRYRIVVTGRPSERVGSAPKRVDPESLPGRTVPTGEVVGAPAS